MTHRCQKFLTGKVSRSFACIISLTGIFIEAFYRQVWKEKEKYQHFAFMLGWNLKQGIMVIYSNTDCVNNMNPNYFMQLKISDFQSPAVPLKQSILIKAVKEYRSPIHNASFGTFKVKNG